MRIALRTLAAALCCAPLAAQLDEPFHFDHAPRWYDVSPNPLVSHPAPEAMTALDFDGDGDLDLVRLVWNRLELVSDDGGSLVLHGTYDPTTFGYLATDVDGGDFNGDGIPDLVLDGPSTAAPYTPQVQALLGDGVGGFAGQPTAFLPWDESAGNTLTAADLNGDGLTDVVALQLYLNEMVALITAGGVQVMNLPPDHHLTDATLGDLSGDGFPELVILARDSMLQQGVLDIRKNDGAGSFLLTASTPLPAFQPFGIELADVDLDGDLDVLTTDPSFAAATTDLLVIPNAGAGALGAPLRSSLLATAWVAADLDIELVDEDGLPDLVASFYMGSGGLVMTASGDGAGAFTPVPGIASLPAGQVALADLTGTGSMELLSAAGHVIPVAPNGSIGLRGVEPATPTPTLQAVLDFDRDGRDDVALYGGSAPTLRVYLSDGEGGFSGMVVAPVTPATYPPIRMDASDVDGDGFTDLVFVAADALLTLHNNAGLSATQVTSDVSSLSSSCSLEIYAHAVGDIDGDGLADVVRVANHFPEGILALGTATGGFTPACLPLIEPAGALAIADLTGDGLPDLAYLSRKDYGLTVLPGTGGPTIFGAPLHTTYTLGLVRGIAIADVDADGDQDVVASTGDGFVTLANDGAGNLTLAQHLDLDQGPWVDLLLVDMNDDGQPDLVARPWYEYASFQIFENLGGSFTAPPIGWDFSASGVSFNVHAIDVGDIDADGFPDVVAGGYASDPSIAQPLLYFNRSALRGVGVPTAGHALELALDAPAAAGQMHLLLAGVHGTWPGLAVTGGVLPLNLSPALFDLSLTGAGGVFVGFLGALDPAGKGTAQIAIPPGLVLPAPIRLDLAFGALDPSGIVRTSNSLGFDLH